MTPATQEIITKDKIRFVEIKSFGVSKDTVPRVVVHRMREILASYPLTGYWVPV